jgi:DNA-binding NtrC family response regulator
VSRVLVVDDEDALRTTLAANLELEGHEVTEADSAERALALAGGAPFDVVVTDIRMPGMTGVELFRALRARGLEVPVILMTAFAIEELVQSALEEGAFTVLPKPFEVDHALRTIARAATRPAVLLVEDGADGEAITSALRATGVAADRVASVDEALVRLATGDVDLCVVDVGHLGAPGAGLVDTVRVRWPAIAVIALASDDAARLLLQLSSGVFAYLRKPFAVRELVRTIAQARGGARRRPVTA